VGINSFHGGKQHFPRRKTIVSTEETKNSDKEMRKKEERQLTFGSPPSMTEKYKKFYFLHAFCAF
jgi:hypothetical protein